MRRGTTTALALGALLIAGVARAAMIGSPSGIDDRLRFEWEAAESGRGRPLIAGYLYNEYKRPAGNVVLLVETLDGSSQVVARTVRIMPSLVPAFGRSYFEIPLASSGASYRLAVTSFDWYAGGSN